MKNILLTLLILASQFGYGQWKKSSFESPSYITEVVFPSLSAAYFASGYGKIYKSTDKGVSWTIIYDFGVFTQPEDLTFINADTGFVNIYGSHYITIDGGVNWNIIGSFFKLKAVGDTLYTTAISNDTVYIQRSIDYGDTWTTLFEKYEVKSQPYRFSVVDAMNAYFINPKELDRIYKTTNGFSSIDTLFITNGDMVLQEKFDYKDLEHGYHYGSWGSESNPKRTWNKGGFFFPIDLDGFGVLPVLDLDFKSNIMFASSLYGKIYSSKNHGLNWTEHLTPSNDPILSIAFYDKDNGIAVTDYGILYTSTGGELLGFEQENSWASEISIYPNPTENILTIESPGFASKLIEIYSIDGVKVQAITTNETVTKIDLTNFPSGVYFVSLTTSEHKATFKAVKR